MNQDLKVFLTILAVFLNVLVIIKCWKTHRNKMKKDNIVYYKGIWDKEDY